MNWPGALASVGRRATAGCVIALCSVLSAGEIHAQGVVAPIAANRPGFIETASVLRRGQLQVELSASVEQLAPATRTWSAPFHLRVGVTDRVEFRVHGNGMLTVQSPERTASGMSDVTFGAAWNATSEHGIIPSSTLITYLTLPSGSVGVRGLATSSALFVPMAWTLPAGRGLSVMPGFTVADEGGGYLAVGTLAAAVSQAIGERVVVFGEVAGEALRPASHGESVVTVGGGGSVRIGQRHQLDAGYATRLTATGPVARLYVGWSVRIRD
jgi:hypothetical protein